MRSFAPPHADRMGALAVASPAGLLLKMAAMRRSKRAGGS
jgi:hypothetical protein